MSMSESRNRWDPAIRVLVALMAVLFAADATEAKEGLYLGAEVVFADIGGPVNASGSISSGDGVGLSGGYGISRHVAVEASLWSTTHDTSAGRAIDLQAALLGLKAALPLANSRIEPYLLFGIGEYRLDARRGDGWFYGAGMDIGLFPAISLTVSVARHAIDFAEPALSGDVVSMVVGISYRFM